MIDQQIRCDVCRAERGPENHWLLIQIQPAQTLGITICPWDDDLSHGPIQHVCGSVCAHKVLDRYLESLRGNQ